MIRFAALYTSIDATTKTNEKLTALVSYFRSASHADAAWATFFLSGYKLRQLVPTKLLRVWAAEEAKIPAWLFDESYHSVGDLAETLTLIVPPGELVDDLPLADWVEGRLLPLRAMIETEQRDAVVTLWKGLYTDYTFALWEGETLVPFAKSYSGLDDSEINLVDRFVRQNTRESFGPVRSVAPALVMEIAFEGIQRSPRHKSGIATRFPRIVRWRRDKKPEDANTLAELIEMLPP